MSDMNFFIRAIDLDNDKVISSQREIAKAKEFGIDAKMGEKVEQVVEKSSKVNLQDILKQIDQTQTVDNKNQDENDPLKKKKLNLLG